MGFDPQNGTNL